MVQSTWLARPVTSEYVHFTFPAPTVHFHFHPTIINHQPSTDHHQGVYGANGGWSNQPGQQDQQPTNCRLKLKSGDSDDLVSCLFDFYLGRG